jgi:hypothetical protein
MRVSGLGIERRALAGLLHFLNIKKIRSVEHVTKTFEGLMYVRATDPLGLMAPPWGTASAYAELQATLRYGLDAIIVNDADRMRRVGALAEHELARVTYQPRPAPRLQGEYDVILIPDDVETCCWLAILFLLDDARAYRRRLGRCGAPGCGRFNLTFEGRPQRHCSDAHRRRYDATQSAKRVKAWRDRRRRTRAVRR